MSAPLAYATKVLYMVPVAPFKILTSCNHGQSPGKDAHSDYSLYPTIDSKLRSIARSCPWTNRLVVRMRQSQFRCRDADARGAGPTPSNPEPAAGSPAPSAMAAPSGQEHLIGMGSETVLTIHGKVVSVDRKKQLVTLELPGGKTFAVKVYNPYNLAAAKPGAPFVAKYYEIATIENCCRASIAAASLSAGIVSATPGQTPGAVVGKQCNWS